MYASSENDPEMSLLRNMRCLLPPPPPSELLPYHVWNSRGRFAHTDCCGRIGTTCAATHSNARTRAYPQSGSNRGEAGAGLYTTHMRLVWRTLISTPFRRGHWLGRICDCHLKRKICEGGGNRRQPPCVGFSLMHDRGVGVRPSNTLSTFIIPMALISSLFSEDLRLLMSRTK